MADIYNLRQMLQTRSIYDIPLRVTFYARVSSDSDEQLNSLENQVQYYPEFIRSHPAWQYVPGYVDEGVSGASAAKREDFQRMISDGKGGKFDLIITKEISRFARNTLDSISYTRELLQAGVGVFFQNDNINTVDVDSELRLTIMACIAQDELRKLSSRVHFGHQQAIKNGVVLGNGRMFGYTKCNGRLVVDEEEAPMVRELFGKYATGQYSMKQLETLFYEKGYRNHNGNKISHSTMSNMISNPKYKGWYVGNKVRVIDLFTKKQKFLPQEEWVMFKDETGQIVPAIVSEEIWESANQVLKRRSDDVKSRQGVSNHGNLLTGKLVCTHCGKPYYRREAKGRDGVKNSKWVCSGKINNGANSCPSLPIYESEIKPLLFDVFYTSEESVNHFIESFIRLYQKSTQDNSTQKKIKVLKKRLDSVEAQRKKLLTFHMSGSITDEAFLSMNQECSKKIDAIKSELDEIIEDQKSGEELEETVDQIRSILLAASKDASEGYLSREFVERYIDKIFVTPESDNTMRLDIKIFTGDTLSKKITHLKRRAEQVSADPNTTAETPTAPTDPGDASRMGQMFKKMIQAYENGMQ